MRVAAARSAQSVLGSPTRMRGVMSAMGKTVYVVVNGNVGIEDSPYHTDENCRFLEQAKTYRERDLDQIPHRRECRECAGEWNPYAGDDGTYVCEHCGREYQHRNGLYKHILLEHEDVVERALGNNPDSPESTRRAVAND